MNRGIHPNIKIKGGDNFMNGQKNKNYQKNKTYLDKTISIVDMLINLPSSFFI